MRVVFSISMLLVFMLLCALWHQFDPKIDLRSIIHGFSLLIGANFTDILIHYYRDRDDW